MCRIMSPMKNIEYATGCNNKNTRIQYDQPSMNLTVWNSQEDHHHLNAVYKDKLFKAKRIQICICCNCS